MASDWGISSITTSLFGDAEPPPSVSSPAKSNSPRPVRKKSSSKSPMRTSGDGTGILSRPTRLESIRNSSRSPPRQLRHASSNIETSSTNSSSSRPVSRSPPRAFKHSSSMQDNATSSETTSSVATPRVGSRSPPRQFKHSASLGQETKKPIRSSLDRNRSSRSPVRESSIKGPHQRTSRSPNRPRADSDGNKSRGNRPRADSDKGLQSEEISSPNKPSLKNRMSLGSSLMTRRGIKSPTSLKTDHGNLAITPPTRKEVRHRSESPTPTPKPPNLHGGWADDNVFGNHDVSNIQRMRNHSDEPMSPGIKVGNDTIISTTEKLRRMVGLRKVAISPRAGIYAGFGRSKKNNNDSSSQNKEKANADGYQPRQRVHSHELVTRTNKNARPKEAMVFSPPTRGGRASGKDGETLKLDENDDKGEEGGKGELRTPHAPTAEVINKGLSEWIVSTRPEIEPAHLVSEDMLDERHASRQVKCVKWRPNFKHQDVNMKFALKINIRGKSDKHSWRLFNEKDVMRSLDSPWHTRLVNTFKSDNCLYMLMEYEPLLSVDHYIEDGVGLRPSGINGARFYTACAIIAIEYMHKRGVVHRDIKPSNFLIDKQGYLKICDYGLAKFLKRDERTNTLLGTIPYLSPELVNEETYNHNVDIWSLGVACYEMAYGSTPFEPRLKELSDKEWSNGVKQNIKQGTFRLVADRGVNLPARLFLKSILNKDTESRLGYDLNYSSVKCHQFFTAIDWPGVLMRTCAAPPVGKPLPSSSRM